MERLALQIIERDVQRAYDDSVFTMLFDMAQLRFEKNILLPLLEKIESTSTGSLYDCYVKMIVHTLEIGKFKAGGDRRVRLSIGIKSRNLACFLLIFSRSYINRDLRYEDEKVQSEENIIKNLKSKGYRFDEGIRIENILQDDKLYDLFKRTIYGKQIELISSLREYLTRKVHQAEIDISCLINKNFAVH